jgi:hypothetical protein
MMLRRTPLKAKPQPRKLPSAPVCRTCRKSTPEVRFPPLRRAVCLSCAPYAPRQPRKRQRGSSQDEKHLRLVRSLECSCRGRGCIGSVEAHHLRSAGNSGVGMRPSSQFCVPLCLGHHREFHTLGRATFAAKYAIDLTSIALVLAEQAGIAP